VTSLTAIPVEAMPRSSIGRVLIVGASIAGPTLAYWLHKYGFDVTLVERGKSVRPGGYPIDLRGPAVEVAERTGILPGVKLAHVDTQRLTWVDEQGKPFVTIRPERLTGGNEGRDLEVPRDALTSLLFEVTRSEIDYRFKDSIRSLTDTATGVSVVFESGRHETYDLVIGADGLHSKTRELVFGSESQFERYIGYCFGACSMPNDLHLAHEAERFTIPGRVATLFAPGDSKILFAILTFKHPRSREVLGFGTAEERKLVADVFAGGGWQIPRIVSAMMVAEDFFFDTVSQIHMPQWSRGRVSLTGDAAHATSFLSGQGSSMALIGAYVLAGELATNSDHISAFASYERIVRSYVEANQALVDAATAVILPETPEALRARDKALQAAAKGGANHAIGSHASTVINAFRLPDYSGRARGSVRVSSLR